jgi:hypothetical protein
VRVEEGSEGGEVCCLCARKIGREGDGQADHHTCSGHADIIISWEYYQGIQKPPARGREDCKATKKALANLQGRRCCAWLMKALAAAAAASKCMHCLMRDSALSV